MEAKKLEGQILTWQDRAMKYRMSATASESDTTRDNYERLARECDKVVATLVKAQQGLEEQLPPARSA